MKTSFKTYNDNGLPLEGYAVFSENTNRPLVILCHAWNGRDAFICQEAESMASWNYNCFALDIYGKNILGNTKQECLALKKPFIDDRGLLKMRLLSGFNAASTLPGIDPSQIAVVGFGFGGLCALDLARHEFNLKGAVSVYGHYDSFPEDNSTTLSAKILLLQGYEDPIVPVRNLEPFSQEMKKKNASWRAHLYGNTMHSFMNPSVNDPESGLLYNASSAQQVREDIRSFLSQIFT